MKLQVQSWNNGGSVYNAEAEETAFLHYSITHRMNAPAEATIVLSDPSGTIAQKYNTDANDVYLGAGKVTIEDPNGTDVFYGRIMKATADTNSRTVTLYCQDWLSQLDEEQVVYDMRENLDGAGLRESTVYPDYDDTAYIGPAVHCHIDGAKAYDAPVYTDQSAEALSAAANDMTLLPAVPVVNDAYYFGWYAQQTGFTLNIGTQGDGTWTITWEYYNGGWVALGGVSDGTSGFTLSGSCVVSWTLPADWVPVAVDSTTLYWVRARVSAFVAVIAQPLGTQVTSSTNFVYASQTGLSADAFNDMYMILSDKMAGNITVTTCPYTYTLTAGGGAIDAFDNNIGDLWTIDTDKHNVGDVGGNWDVVYNFRVWTPDSSFYTSCTGARITCVLNLGSDVYLQLYNGATYDTIAEAIGTAGTAIVRTTFTVPDSLLSTMFDANGEVAIKFKDDNDGAIYLYYVAVSCDFTTTGYSSSITISDTYTKGFMVGTDLAADATRVWHGLPFAVARPIYKHIDSAETPGDIITAGDIIVTLTCAATIEHTTGISTRRYINKTRYEILQDLATQDKAQFWTTLGTATVNWKSTYNNGAPETLTDTDVNAWSMIQDYSTMANEFNIFGIRVGDHELFSNVTDATSIAKHIATRSQTKKGTGLTSQYDTAAFGTALVNQYKDVLKIITASIRGNTAKAAHAKTLVLGDEVSITSTYLGLTSIVYIVQRWEYDSRQDLTTLLLHPRVSQIGLQKEEFGSIEQALQTNRKGDPDKLILTPADNVT